MRIGQLAQSVGVDTQTIRFYERQGLLPPPGRQGERLPCLYRETRWAAGLYSSLPHPGSVTGRNSRTKALSGRPSSVLYRCQCLARWSHLSCALADNRSTGAWETTRFTKSALQRWPGS